ncbi:DEAD/DEAH box helicase [Aminobacter aminovorans]|uniref:Helicase/UvrB N-terminal domain-containing protein n=1 Tax=Aminobacter aminovorans TaxID=83263 RepID=A0AAC8YRN5_AMIAI|nr:pentapeptide repeat-containing protein [Aminobacter aminovorans]AMS43248.1 hypothetical protein AA2016_4333 [Aminobacter aminovorans]MBB3706202.1 hypothetical protein [Aminobacter aminovorans]
MANRFGLNEEQERVLDEILKGDGADFSALVRIAGLDPLVDFRGADLRGVDFGRSDLEGYDFSDADLSGCRFDRARLRGAIFANNREDGTVWPRPPSKRRSSRAVLRATTNFELHPFHHEAMSSIIGALEQGVERPVVLMPLGTGRTVLLEALLSELDNRDMLGVALVYASTQVAVEQLRQHFSQRFGSDAVAGSNSKEMLVPSDARLIVAASSSLRADASRYSLSRTFGGVSHIFIFDGAMTSSRLRYLQSQYLGVQIVIFANSLPTAEVHRTSAIEEGEIVFDLSYSQAVDAGLLEPAAIHGYRSLGSVEHANEEEMQSIVFEVLGVVHSMHPDAVGGVVCRSTDSVRKLARELHKCMEDHGRGYAGIQRVVQHTSPSADESLVRAALDLPGTLLLMNDVVASDFDWTVLDYAIVLTRLRSPERLAFTRRRQGRTQRLQVIDYMQNFDRMASSRW